MTKRLFVTVVTAMILALGLAGPSQAGTCPNGRSSTAAMWLSILHPGLGEWHLHGWGSFRRDVPKKKFWMGFIPVFGFPYLNVVSAIDTAKCRTDDNLDPDS